MTYLLFFYTVAMLLPHIFEDFGAVGSRMRTKEMCNFLAYFGKFGTPNPTSGIRHTAPLIPLVPSFAAVLQPCMSSVSQPDDLRNDFPPSVWIRGCGTSHVAESGLYEMFGA
ncbi:hypothetical protein ARMSODRAFT_1028494 [Armillaria solidipes]|uniref:Uncharacterized protein n=1 Tax=Armillaria solidipes TaxID=1076256 RepID=A0A2H3AGW0_9AGAR|nr:hypothetical protein ARMSODRAFT_1028494 [Armillaria solidipes]